jgi:hypothetical protein
MSENIQEKIDEVPQIIQNVGFDFKWDSKKVWALELPVEDMPIDELLWHFDIPFWDSEGTDAWNLKPWDVIANPEKEPSHFSAVEKAGLDYPIDIMWNKGRWGVLDGLHRLVKYYLQGAKIVKVRKVHEEMIPLILKDVL